MFKVGDKVKCVDASGTRDLEHGEIYTVKNVNHSLLVQVVNSKLVGSTYNYTESRFIKVPHNLWFVVHESSIYGQHFPTEKEAKEYAEDCSKRNSNTIYSVYQLSEQVVTKEIKSTTTEWSKP